jgi:hypothetical protein
MAQLFHACLSGRTAKQNKENIREAAKNLLGAQRFVFDGQA